MLEPFLRDSFAVQESTAGTRRSRAKRRSGLAEGRIASIKDIDTTARAAVLGHLMGPFQPMDMADLTSWISLPEHRTTKLGTRRRTPRTVSELVAPGKLGRKTGARFYKYTN